LRKPGWFLHNLFSQKSGVAAKSPRMEILPAANRTRFRQRITSQKQTPRLSIEAFVAYLPIQFRLFDSGEEALLTCSDGFDRSTRIVDVRLHRQHGPVASDTFSALRISEVFAWYHAAKVVTRGESLSSQRFHRKLRFSTLRYPVIHVFHRRLYREGTS
jgi:hypothetical protein